MKSWAKIILTLVLIVALGAIFYALGRGNRAPMPGGTSTTPTTTTPSTGGTGTTTQPDVSNMIRLTSPSSGALVKSPLAVTGEARGNWYFEASFPVRILDANGRELGVVPAQAQGEWMTTEFVPFRAVLSFATPATATGTLVLEKDNPSGLPENAAELRVPVRFR